MVLSWTISHLPLTTASCGRSCYWIHVSKGKVRLREVNRVAQRTARQPEFKVSTLPRSPAVSCLSAWRVSGDRYPCSAPLWSASNVAISPGLSNFTTYILNAGGGEHQGQQEKEKCSSKCCSSGVCQRPKCEQRRDKSLWLETDVQRRVD